MHYPTITSVLSLVDTVIVTDLFFQDTIHFWVITIFEDDSSYISFVLCMYYQVK